jgi:hypothetical protein
MKKFNFNSVAATTAAVISVAIVPAGALATNNGSNNPGNKVTICHATGSATNPFVVISPNANGVINGHYAHQDNRDIIPSFSYKSHGVTKTFAGQNLGNGGQAILDNGCVVPNAGGQGGGNVPGTVTTGQVLGAATAAVSTNAVGAVDAGAGGANAFSLTSLDRVW